MFPTFARSQATVLLAHTINAGLGMLLTAVAIRSAGDAVFGGYSILTSVAILVLGVSSLGVGFRYKRSLAAQAVGTGAPLFYPQFYFQFAIVCAALALCLVVTNPLGRALLDPGVALDAWVLPAFLLSYFFFTQASDYFRYSLRLGTAMLLSVIQPATHVALVLCWWRWSGRPTSLAVLFGTFVVSTVLCTAPFCWRMWREMGLKKPAFSAVQLRDDMRVGFPLILSFFADYLLSSTARYAIAVQLDLPAVAAFSTAYSLANVIAVLPRVAATALPPLMARAYDAEDHSQAELSLVWSLRFFLLAAIPFVAGSCVVGKEALALLATPALAERAWPMVPVLALASLFYGLIILLNNVLFVTSKTTLLLRVTLAAAGLNLGLSWIGLQFCRAPWVAAAAQLLAYCGAFLLIRRRIVALWAVRLPAGFVLRVAGCAAIMAAAMGTARRALPPSETPALFITTVASGGVIYVLALLATGAVREETKLIRALAGGKDQEKR